MIVICETTFIIEFVLEQEEADACNTILDAVPVTTGLVLPAFSIAEAGMMLERRRGECRDFMDHELARHTREANRSKVLARYSRIIADLNAELLISQKAETDRFRNFCSRGFETVAMTEEILLDALNYRSLGIIERLPDAIVLASVLAFLDSGPAANGPICFVTRDAAFGIEHINKLLRAHDCKFLGSFNAAAGWIHKYSSPNS